MVGQATEKTLSDIEALLTTQAGYLDGVEALLTTQAGYLDGVEGLLTTIDAVLDNILTAIEGIGGMTARTYAAPATSSYTASSTAELVAANANRKLLVIESIIVTSPVYIGVGNDAVSGRGIELGVSAAVTRVTFGGEPGRMHSAQGNIIEVTLPLTTQAINIISASNQTFRIQEAD